MIPSKEELQKVARICWNAEGWRVPSGRDGKSKGKNSHEHKYGYGHEEWLLDETRIIDGYHYGFIQALNRKRDADYGRTIYSGHTFDIHLYSINSNTKERYWVGKISNAIVLDSLESKKIYKEYKSRGWIKEMSNQLKKCKLKTTDWQNTKPGIFFNLKFKVEDMDLLDPCFRFSHKDQAVPATYYTTLLDFKDLPQQLENQINKEFKFTPGHSEGKTSTNMSIRKKTGEIALHHNKMQTMIYNQLVKEYGEGRVGTENKTGFRSEIDIVVEDEKGYIFFELKTGSSIKSCIREALSQLLEYSYWPNKRNAHKLVIVSSRKTTQDSCKYLRYLRSEFKLPIYYRRFNWEKLVLEEKEF